MSWLPMSFGRGERLGQGGNCMGRHTIRAITQLLHIDIWFYNASTSGRQHEEFVSKAFCLGLFMPWRALGSPAEDVCDDG